MSRFLVVLCVIALVIGCTNASRIDEIIHKHWLRIKSENKVKLIESMSEFQQEQSRSVNNNGDTLDQSQPEERKPIDLSYHCQHDRIVERQRQIIKPLLDSLEANYTKSGWKTLDGRATSRVSLADDSYRNMRFFVNSDTIGDDPRACYQAGTTVPMFDYNTGQDASYTCQNVDVLSPALQDLFENDVMPTLLEIFQEVILVPDTGNTVLDQDMFNRYGGLCDDDLPIPQSYVTNGFDGDYAVFVTARPADNPGTVAYAGACNFEVISNNPQRLGRPLAGRINFSPRYFQQYTGGYTEFEFRAAVKVAVHELTHALGFSSFFYDSFVDENGEFYNPPIGNQNTVTGTSAANNPYSVTIGTLGGPHVLSFARDHFQCDTLTGVPLEDTGGAGTAGSHWDMRAVGNEFMAGFINPLMPVSGLTLSLYEDMGWYKVDKTKAEYYAWGKDQGCGFIEDRCENSWPQTTVPGYWCTAGETIGCTGDRVAAGTCGVYQYQGNLPPYYQHFPQANVGGAVGPADYCPFTDAAANAYCLDTSRNPTIEGESFSKDSRCFEYAQGSPSVDNPVGAPTACFETRCPSETELQVKVDGTWFDCPPEGGSISVGGKLNGGAVNCPPTSILCRQVAGFGGDSSKKGLSKAAIAGIVVAVLIGVIAIGAIIFIFAYVRPRRARGDSLVPSFRSKPASYSGNSNNNVPAQSSNAGAPSQANSGFAANNFYSPNAYQAPAPKPQPPPQQVAQGYPPPSYNNAAPAYNAGGYNPGPPRSNMAPTAPPSTMGRKPLPNLPPQSGGQGSLRQFNSLANNNNNAPGPRPGPPGTRPPGPPPGRYGTGRN